VVDLPRQLLLHVCRAGDVQATPPGDILKSRRDALPPGAAAVAKKGHDITHDGEIRLVVIQIAREALILDPLDGSVRPARVEFDAAAAMAHPEEGTGVDGAAFGCSSLFEGTLHWWFAARDVQAVASSGVCGLKQMTIN